VGEGRGPGALYCLQSRSGQTQYCRNLPSSFDNVDEGCILAKAKAYILHVQYGHWVAPFSGGFEVFLPNTF
jgi:hypothetical protein